MTKHSKKAKSSGKIERKQAPSGLNMPNILDTFRTISFSAKFPEGVDPASIARLIHDLQSAANAFSFLIDQLASDPENCQDDRHRRKLNQLRQYDAVNRNCMDIITRCLERQSIQA